MANIGEFRSRIRIVFLVQTIDEFGGIATAENSNLTCWAKVESRGTSPNNSHNQQLLNYDYKITIRYQTEIQINNEAIVDFETKRLKINSIEVDKEGEKKFYILRCSNIGK